MSNFYKDYEIKHAEFISRFNQIKDKYGWDEFDEARNKVIAILKKMSKYSDFYFLGDNLTKSVVVINITDNHNVKYSSWYVQIGMISGFVNRLLKHSYINGKAPRFTKIQIPYDLYSFVFTYNNVIEFECVDSFYNYIGHTRKSKATRKFMLKT